VTNPEEEAVKSSNTNEMILFMVCCLCVVLLLLLLLLLRCECEMLVQESAPASCKWKELLGESGVR
jgi:hypothetical protein